MVAVVVVVTVVVVVVAVSVVVVVVVVVMFIYVGCYGGGYYGGGCYGGGYYGGCRVACSVVMGLLHFRQAYLPCTWQPSRVTCSSSTTFSREEPMWL